MQYVYFWGRDLSVRSILLRIECKNKLHSVLLQWPRREWEMSDICALRVQWRHLMGRGLAQRLSHTWWTLVLCGWTLRLTDSKHKIGVLNKSQLSSPKQKYQIEAVSISVLDLLWTVSSSVTCFFYHVMIVWQFCLLVCPCMRQCRPHFGHYFHAGVSSFLQICLVVLAHVNEGLMYHCVVCCGCSLFCVPEKVL